MGKKFSEDDVSWSCIEKYNDYSKVCWYMRKNGIPTYRLYGKDGKEMEIKTDWDC